jgi:dynein heavy chain
MLATGYVPELFAKDELDGIYGKLRGEAKSMGYLDTPEQLQEFFVTKIRRNLHVALCFSPVGDAFRFRARMFPALINGTTIDWFTSWPRDALVGVAQKFLSNPEKVIPNIAIEFPDEETTTAIANHMANTHLSIEAANIEFRERERRYNYTTPTSFLELINFYLMLLNKKQGNITNSIERLEKGLTTMDNTTKQVDKLKAELVLTLEDVEVEKEKTDKLIAVVTVEAAEADREQAEAQKIEDATNIVANAAKEAMAHANKELEAAVPAMEAAKEAVDCLKVNMIQEFKSYQAPPNGADDVTAAV